MRLVVSDNLKATMLDALVYDLVLGEAYHFIKTHAAPFQTRNPLRPSVGVAWVVASWNLVS